MINLLATWALIVIQLLGWISAIGTRFNTSRCYAIPVFRWILAILTGISLSSTGQSPHVWSSCLITISVMLVIVTVDFSRRIERKTI